LFDRLRDTNIAADGSPTGLECNILGEIYGDWPGAQFSLTVQQNDSIFAFYSI